MHLPTGETDVASTTPSMKYQAAGTPLIVLAGKEYGTGSSRDWAAKGTMLLGIRAVIAESYERIHRSNLIGMGVLPLQFKRRRDGREPRAQGRGDLRHRRPRARPREGSDSHRDRRDRQEEPSRPSCASTRRRSRTTSSTEGSCSTCCGSSRRRSKRRSAARDLDHIQRLAAPNITPPRARSSETSSARDDFLVRQIVSGHHIESARRHLETIPI